MSEFNKNTIIDLVACGLDTHGEVRLDFSGESMRPALEPGMQISVKKCAVDRLRPGDIVFYKNSGIMVAHRLLKVVVSDGRTFMLTRGDNQSYNLNSSIEAESILGTVTAAYCLKSPQLNVLIQNKFVGGLYIALSDWAKAGAKIEINNQGIAGSIKRYLFYVSFLVCRKIINAIYIGVRNGQLYMRRSAGDGIAK